MPSSPVIWLDKKCSSDDFTYRNTRDHSAVPTQLSTLCLKINISIPREENHFICWIGIHGNPEAPCWALFYVTDGLEAAEPQPADGTGKLQLFQKLFWKSLTAQRSIVQELELPQPSKWCLCL